MSQLNVDNIQNRTGSNGGPNFPSGISVAVGQTAYIHGNLQVDGTETIINTETLNVADKTVGIGSTSNASNTTADGSGIEVFASSSQTGNNKTLTWGNTANSWEFGPNDVGLKVGTGVTVYGGTGIVSATSFKGDGSLLTGIDATAIQTGNTSVQTVDTGSDGHVKMTTEGGERVRVGPAGQIGLGGANYGTSGQVITSAGTGAAPTWSAIPAGGNIIEAVANGSIANNKAVKIDTDGKVSEIKTSSVNRSTPSGLSGSSSAGQNFYINDGNSTGGHIRANRKSTTVYDPDTDRVLIIWGDSGYLKCRVGTPNRTTGVVTWGNVISINSSDNFKEMSAVYDTTANKIILFVAKDNSPSRLEGYVGTVSSSGNSVTWSSAVSPGNGEIRYLSSAFDSTTGRTIVLYQEVSTNQLVYKICYVNGGTLTWHTGQTSSGNQITTDMFNNGANVSHFDVCSVDSSKWLVCVALVSSVPTGFVQYGLYTKIVNAPTSTTATPTYANAGAIHMETASSTQRGQYPSVAWDPTLEKIMFTWQAHGSGSDTTSNWFGMLCYFNSGKTDITINNATYNVGGNGNTYDDGQLAFDSSSGRWMFCMEDYAGVRGAFLSCGGSGNNTLTVGSRGTVISPNPSEFGSMNHHDLIDITNGCMFSFYTNQIVGSSAANKTLTSVIATTTIASNLTNMNHYVGYADQAYTNGQTATIKTYGNNVDTLSGLTAGSSYFVQGNGTLATTQDATLSGYGADLPFAGTALSATKLLIRDPLTKNQSAST